MNDIHRPVTSKARGICKYYTEPRGCFARNKCKFLHTTEPVVGPLGPRPALTPYDQAKRCKYFAEGFCKRGDKCWFLHVVDKQQVNGSEAESDDEELCSICFERPSTYGLLGGCSHIFCLECIRQWRDPAGKDSDISNTKKCPMCRAKCRYIIPSSRFLKDGQEKTQVVQNYKDSMNRIPCMHFEKSKAKHPKKPPLCPFGNECFYKHLNADGTPHVLKDGISAAMRAWKARMRGNNPTLYSFMNEDLLGARSLFVDIVHPEGSEAELHAMNIAGSVAMDMFDQMVADVMDSNMNNSGGRGRGRGNSGRLRRGQAQLREATMEIAMSRLRAQLHRIDNTRNHEDVHPMVVPGTLAPSSNWDLEAEGEGLDNGWGWNDLAPGANPADNIDLMGHLELMADHMLLVRGRDDGSPPPPLEPIGRGDTPPPPLEPIGGRPETSSPSSIPMAVRTTAEQDDDDDDMPSLQSVSNSSESEDSDSDEDQDSDYDTTNRVVMAERMFDFGFRPAERTQHSTPLRPRTSAPPPTDNASSRFSTTVARDETISVDMSDEGNADDEDEALPNKDDSDSQSDHEHEVDDLSLNAFAEQEPHPVDLVLTTAAEPPFVTDGRGRVVWSNKSSTRQSPAEVPPESSEETEPTATGSRSLLGRMYDALF